MTALVLSLLLSLPCVALAAGAADRATLAAAGLTRFCDEADVAKRHVLPAPGIVPRPGVASPTRAPWIAANGWQFMRAPRGRYVYELPAGKAALAAAEAFAYGGDAVLKIDSSDAASLAAMLTFLERLPVRDLPPVADIGVLDDGSAITGEVMNLLARRNLLFAIVPSPSPQFGITIAVGTPQYPREEAADPSAFALKIRRALTDDRRSLRIFGSEVVVARLLADGRRARVHLLNYGGREIEGLRVRLRGTYRGGTGHVAGAGRVELQDFVAADGSTEFSVPRLAAYAVIDLEGS